MTDALEDLEEVQREYRLKSADNPVDYALSILRIPRLFVEAKALGGNLNDRRWANQIMGYAKDGGGPLLDGLATAVVARGGLDLRVAGQLLDGAQGYVYVPAACAAGSPCRLLVALHGCLQSASAIQLTFVDDANLNQYADTNDLVVLYPQAAPTSLSNPNACWDWWGYLGASDTNYAQHGGAQLETIMRIIHALGG